MYLDQARAPHAHWALVGPPWALMGPALVGSLGPSWAGPLWAPWALMDPGHRDWATVYEPRPRSGLGAYLGCWCKPEQKVITF